MSDRDFLVFDANMSAALRSHYRRAGAEQVDDHMPYDAMLMAESDGEDGEPGDYEMRQRTVGVRGLMRYLTSGGSQPLEIMKRMYAVGRAMAIEPFCSLTMEESGMMFSESKAAHSWRCKVLSGKIKLTGAKGVRMPGQKTPGCSAAYAAAQRGNQNRKKGKKKNERGN